MAAVTDAAPSPCPVRGAGLAAAAVALLGGGCALGRREAAGAAAALGAAGFLSRVAELNDPAALRRHRERTAYRHGGRRACALPPVWIEAGQ